MDASLFGRGAGEGLGVHICTGPVAVAGAAPGDVLEVRILDVAPRPCANPEHAGKTFADEDTTEEAAKEEYRKIADRRVRLGLVLSEIGEKNKITVSDDEVSRAVIERARQMPGREKEVWDFYRQNAQALAQLRAPIFEDKVVDFILELAKVTEKKVSREDLYKDDEADKAA